MNKYPTAIEYYDKFAIEYDQLAKEYCWLSPRVMFGLLYEKAQKGKRLLDIGIGTGLSAIPFHRMGMDIYGVDGSKKMLGMCEDKGFAKELKLLDLESSLLPYEDSYFDLVIANGVLYFINNIDHVLSESVRVLKNGGTLCVNFEELSNGIQEDYRNYSNCVISKKLKEKTGVTVYRHSIELIKKILASVELEVEEAIKYYAYTSPSTKEDVYFTLLCCKKREEF